MCVKAFIKGNFHQRETYRRIGDTVKVNMFVWLTVLCTLHLHTHLFTKGRIVSSESSK